MFDGRAFCRGADKARSSLAATSNQPVSTRTLRRVRSTADPLLPPGRRRKLAGRSAIAVLIVLAAVTGSLAGLTLVYSANLPQIEELEHYRPSTITDLYDRNGQVIGSFALERREVVGYDGFAPILREAVISIEDKNFYSHWGINVFRVAGAAWHDIRTHGRGQGASTLTMQLARDLFLSSDRTVMRKVQEAYLAIQIERAFTKQQIFTLYANQIYLGSGNYGFEAASEYFFSRHAKDLTLTEAALLAGLPKGPVAYSPLLNPERALRRRNLVLSEMESDGLIGHAQADAAPRPRRRAPLRSACISQSRKALWRRGSRKRCGKNSISTLGQRKCTRLGCAWTRRSISNCSRPRIELYLTGWPPMSGAADGPAGSRMFWQTARRSTITGIPTGRLNPGSAITCTRW